MRLSFISLTLSSSLTLSLSLAFSFSDHVSSSFLSDVSKVRMGERVLGKDEIEALGGFEEFLKDEQSQFEKLH